MLVPALALALACPASAQTNLDSTAFVPIERVEAPTPPDRTWEAPGMLHPSQSTTWTAEGNQSGAQFASAVANAGDVNGDGFDDLLVGARYHDGAFTDEGAAFLYYGSAGGLATSPAWTALGGQAGAHLGVSTAGVGDVNGDGYDDILVGADGWSNGEPGEGAAMLFLGGPAGPSLAPDLTLEGNQPNAAFGFAIAGVGDIDGDGLDDWAVGAPGHDADEGAVFVYRGDSLALPSAWAWSFQVGDPGAKFGGAVAGAGDVNGDGVDDLLVGAQYHGASDRGAAFVFYGGAGGPGASPDWTLLGSQDGCGLGNAVAGAGDVNGDGFDDVLIAAQRYDEGALTDAGRVQLHLGSTSGLALAPASTLYGAQAHALLGNAIAAAGRHDTDAYDDVVVGERYFDGLSGVDEGQVTVYRGGPAGLDPVPAFVATGGQAGAQLGFSLSSLDAQADGGTDVAAGAPYQAAGQAEEGVAFVYPGAPAIPKTWFVDASAAPGGNGSAASPFQTIQEGIDAALFGGLDTVLVLPGIYAERIDFLGKRIAVVGRDGAALTTIDGGGPQNPTRGPVVTIEGALDWGPAMRLEGLTVTGGAAWYSGPSEGGGVRIVAMSPWIRDCTIIACSADEGGGGIYLQSSSALVQNCVITGNEGGGWGTGGRGGGGICAVNSGATIIGCTVSDNTATWFFTCGGNQHHGGGVFCDAASSVWFDDCQITGNQAFTMGGGVYCELTSSATFTNCSISGNRAEIAGGAYRVLATDSIIAGNLALGCDGDGYSMAGGVMESDLKRCAVGGNTAFNVGGGAHSTNLVDCVVSYNWSVGNEYWTSAGGGAYGSTLQGCSIYRNVVIPSTAWYYMYGPGFGGGTADSTLVDCVVYENEVEGAFINPGGVWIYLEGFGGGTSGGSLLRTVVYDNVGDRGSGSYEAQSLDHCVVYGNRPSDSIPNWLAHAGVEGGAISNSIVWGNEGQQVTGASSVSYSNAPWTGPGNVWLDPLFWDAEGGDFHLQPGSPCIDAGDPSSPLDPDGSIADMGAFPFDPDYCPPATTYCTAGTSANGCTATIGATGTPSLTAPSGFDVSVTGVEGQRQGILFWGLASQAAPWGSGTSFLCIQAPVKRTAPQKSGGTAGLCDGSLALDFNAWMQANPAKAPGLGDVVYLQAWFRDPPSPKTTSLSDGLRFVICP